MFPVSYGRCNFNISRENIETIESNPMVRRGAVMPPRPSSNFARRAVPGRDTGIIVSARQIVQPCSSSLSQSGRVEALAFRRRL